MLNLPNMPFTRANPKQLVAALPIQEVPADGDISVDQLNLTKIDFRGDGYGMQSSSSMMKLQQV
jgi:hypothetical protein